MHAAVRYTRRSKVLHKRRSCGVTGASHVSYRTRHYPSIKLYSMNTANHKSDASSITRCPIHECRAVYLLSPILPAHVSERVSMAAVSLRRVRDNPDGAQVRQARSSARGMKTFGCLPPSSRSHRHPAATAPAAVSRCTVRPLPPPPHPSMRGHAHTRTHTRDTSMLSELRFRRPAREPRFESVSNWSVGVACFMSLVCNQRCEAKEASIVCKRLRAWLGSQSPLPSSPGDSARTPTSNQPAQEVSSVKGQTLPQWFQLPPLLDLGSLYTQLRKAALNIGTASNPVRFYHSLMWSG